MDVSCKSPRDSEETSPNDFGAQQLSKLAPGVGVSVWRCP
jgi:hypothetical protein